MNIHAFSCVLFGLIVSQTCAIAGGGILAYEGFTNYVAGDLPGQAFQGVGFSIGGSWIGLDSSYSVNTPDAGQINPSGLISPVVAINGGKVRVESGNLNLGAKLDTSPTGSFANAGLIDPVSGTIGGGNVSGTLYISFLFQEDYANRSSGEYAGIHLTRGNTGTNGVLIGDSHTAWAYSLFDPVSNTSVDLIDNNGTGRYYIMDANTHLFVVRIVYVPNAPDILTAWLDPIVSLGETNQNTSFSYMGTSTGDYSFDRFFLSGGSSSSFDYDELRFGTSWASVLPGNSTFKLPASGPIVPELAPLEQVMTNVIANYGLYAGTVALMKNSLLVYRQGYGWRDSNLTQVIHPDNLCRLASVSKPITGSAISQLVHAGKISMNTPVYAFLGIEPFRGVLGDPRIPNITVQELMNHSGGWTGGGSASECVFPTVSIFLDKYRPV